MKKLLNTAGLNSGLLSVMFFAGAATSLSTGHEFFAILQIFCVGFTAYESYNFYKVSKGLAND